MENLPPDNVEKLPNIKISFGKRMAEQRRLKKMSILEQVVENTPLLDDIHKVTIREPTKPIDDETIKDELYRRLKEETAKNSTSKTQVEELKKIISGKKSGNDPLAILDYDPNQLNGFERAFAGWGAGTIWFIRTIGPLIIFLGIIYYAWNVYKNWIIQNAGNIFNVIAYVGMFVGIGNMMYDVLQKKGQLKNNVKFMDNKPIDILTLKRDEVKKV